MIGIAGTALSLSSAVPVAVFAAVWGVAGLGVGLMYSPITLTVLASAPRGQEGAASASLELSGVLGVALGTGIGGALVALAASLELERTRAECSASTCSRRRSRFGASSWHVPRVSAWRPGTELSEG